MPVILIANFSPWEPYSSISQLKGKCLHRMPWPTYRRMEFIPRTAVHMQYKPFTPQEWLIDFALSDARRSGQQILSKLLQNNSAKTIFRLCMYIVCKQIIYITLTEREPIPTEKNIKPYTTLDSRLILGLIQLCMGPPEERCYSKRVKNELLLEERVCSLFCRSFCKPASLMHRISSSGLVEGD